MTIASAAAAAAKPLVLAMNKPRGVVCSTVDQDGSGTVFDVLKPGLPPALRGIRWHCVGRLDKHTTGLLLFTNDARFVAHATQPATHLPKTYLADVGAVATDAKVQPLREGIVLHDGPCRPAIVELVAARQVRVTITEGRNHQIKHMLGAVKLPVLALHREAIGSLWLPPDQRPGEVRRVASKQVERYLGFGP